MLGRLVTWLRILGLDTEEVDAPWARVPEGQVLLTRRTRLRGRPGVFFVAHDRLEDQLRQVVRGLGIKIDPARLFTRCLRCNSLVASITKQEAVDLVPEYTLHTAESFSQCPGCGRVYWPGSHGERALRLLDRL